MTTAPLHIPTDANGPLIAVLMAMNQNLAVIGKNTAPEIGHLPVVAPTTDGDWGVFCHQCSIDKQDFVYPCRLPIAEPESYPPERLQPVTTGAPDADKMRITAAARALRDLLMDTPSDSVHSTKIKAILAALLG